MGQAFDALYQRAYVTAHGQAAWDAYRKELNALHRLDMVAGGNPTDLVGMGDARANQSIGPQWRADSRRGKLMRYAKEMAKARCPMNVRLRVCKDSGPGGASS